MMIHSIKNKSLQSILLAIIFLSCGPIFSQKLSPQEFAEKIKSDSAAVLDVRTAGEFKTGHLEKAVNINFNDKDFVQNVTGVVDKAYPVYLYCLSGGRSAKAADQLRGEGYTVYELDGGILKWRSAGLPEEKNITEKRDTGLNSDQFTHLVNSGEKVLVDFYAEWCAPCKVMEPYINEIEKKTNGKIKVIRIDIDKNEALAKSLNVDAVPVLHIYKNGKLTWEHLGYISKKDLNKQIIK